MRWTPIFPIFIFVTWCRCVRLRRAISSGRAPPMTSHTHAFRLCRRRVAGEMQPECMCRFNCFLCARREFGFFFFFISFIYYYLLILSVRSSVVLFCAQTILIFLFYSSLIRTTPKALKVGQCSISFKNRTSSFVRCVVFVFVLISGASMVASHA